MCRVPARTKTDHTPLCGTGAQGDAIVTDVAAVETAVERNGGADKVLCVVTTTSCFAPRLPDKVDEVARICSSTGIGHVINNAYGVQCSRTCRLINR